MAAPDLNLLRTLDVLLAEGSVAGAARRLRLSPSATSRALARLRETTGDPLLVQAGRGLVPTPRALELRERVGRLVEEAKGVLAPAPALDLAGLVRTFTVRAREGFVETYGAALIERVTAEAPGVRLRFASKPDKESGPLRDGTVDLETGVLGSAIGPEVRSQILLRDRFVGASRSGHALATAGSTASAYGNARHILVAGRGIELGPLDRALAEAGVERRVGATVDAFSAALALARSSDLIATVPERHTAGLRAGMFTFPLPFAAPEFAISLLWHPRTDADPAHRWLRACVREVCQA